MKYWLDTEFIEDGKAIDLISMGIVAEDGRTYYAQNSECKFRRASDWVRANVLTNLYDFDKRWMRPQYFGPEYWHTKWYTRKNIAQQIGYFCDPEKYGEPEFWGYYADYDWVVVCQLFGTMMDLPKGWPMLAYDLRQALNMKGLTDVKQPDNAPHNALMDAHWARDTWGRYISE